MGLLKAEIKMGVMQEIAQKMARFNSEAEKRVTDYEAGARALDQAAPKIATLVSFIEKDLDDGKFDELSGEPLLMAQYTKDWVARAINTVTLMADSARDSAKLARGRVAAFNDAMDFMEGLFDTEKAKKVRIEEMIRTGEIKFEEEGVMGDDLVGTPPDPEDGRRPPSRPPGVRPAPSLAQQRRAEAEAEEAVPQSDVAPSGEPQEASEASEGEVEEPKAETEEDAQKADEALKPKVKRKRRKKAKKES